MDLAVHPPRWFGLEELRPALRTFLRRHCRDGFEVEDVVQETLLRAARYRDTLADARNLRGWAQRIAVNVLRDRVRRATRLARVEAGEDGLDLAEGREPAPGELEDDVQIRVGASIVDRAAAVAVLRLVLAELRADDRAVLCAFYRGGEDCARAAVECGIPHALVKVRLFRARRRLQRALECRLTRLPASQREHSASGGERALAATP